LQQAKEKFSKTPHLSHLPPAGIDDVAINTWPSSYRFCGITRDKLEDFWWHIWSLGFQRAWYQALPGSLGIRRLPSCTGYVIVQLDLQVQMCRGLEIFQWHGPGSNSEKPVSATCISNSYRQPVTIIEIGHNTKPMICLWCRWNTIPDFWKETCQWTNSLHQLLHMSLPDDVAGWPGRTSLSFRPSSFGAHWLSRSSQTWMVKKFMILVDVRPGKPRILGPSS